MKIEINETIEEPEQSNTIPKPKRVLKIKSKEEQVVEPIIEQKSKPDYCSMKKPELQQLCKDRKLKGFWDKNKNVLIEMLSK